MTSSKMGGREENKKKSIHSCKNLEVIKSINRRTVEVSYLDNMKVAQQCKYCYDNNGYSGEDPATSHFNYRNAANTACAADITTTTVVCFDYLVSWHAWVEEEVVF